MQISWRQESLGKDLVASQKVKRLAHISFLGAIDHIYPQRSSNRFFHSSYVTHLAFIVSEIKNIPQTEKNLLIAAALLHDIGHAPLSHSLEPVFREEFGLDHHLMNRRIITGEAGGTEIKKILENHQIDQDELLTMIEGHHQSDIGHFFSGPINLDTVEGMDRCRLFFSAKSDFSQNPKKFIEKMAQNHMKIQDEIDRFWMLKHEIYSQYINAPHIAIFDMIAQIYMRDNIEDFGEQDFQEEDHVFLEKHPSLCKIFNDMKKREYSLKHVIPKDWMDQKITIRKRNFIINHDILLDSSPVSLEKRYSQEKSSKTCDLGDLIEIKDQSSRHHPPQL